MVVSEAGLLQQALALHRDGKLGGAQRRYEDVLKINPRNYDAQRLLGVVEFQRGNHRAARRALSRAIELAPQVADAHYFLGRCLADTGEFAAAVTAYEACLSRESGHDNAAISLAYALTELGQFDAALMRLDAVLATNPGQRDAVFNRAGLLRRLLRFNEALADFDRALALDPFFMPARMGRGEVLLLAGRHAEAIGDFEHCLQADPASFEARSSAAQARLFLADWRSDDTDTALLDAVRRKRQWLPLPLLLSIGGTPQDELASARHYAARTLPRQELALPKPGWRHDKIRIAYLSSDFRDHAVGHMTAGLLEHHDRSRFSPIGVSIVPVKADDVTARIQAAVENFVDVSSLGDNAAAELLRQREVDIVVDLSGYTVLARPGIMAARAAPVQVNYLGHPATMGAPFMDYIVGDRIVTPPQSAPSFSEKIVTLPDTFFVTDNKRRVGERVPDRVEAGLPPQGFVFCAFTSAAKISPEMFAVWMRLLRGVEGSVLWLSAMGAVARDNLVRAAAGHGVAAERMVFAPRVAANEDHLARQRLADLVLDTLPYNGHSTTADALWIGVPVLTCVGSSFAGRVGASLLAAAGVGELVTQSHAEYEALALQLARDQARLGALRDRLATTRHSCALFDTARFTRHLEAACQHMFDAFQRGEPIASFAIAPDTA